MAIKLHKGPIIVGNKGTVIVDGDTVADINSSQARALAAEAVNGRMNRPGLSEQSGPYPVDPDTDEPYENPLQGLKSGTRFRQDFVFQGGF